MSGLNENTNCGMSLAELERLVSRYFDCETTEDEERLLKRTLASCDYSSPVIDEARVALGYFLVGRSVSKKKRTGTKMIIPLRTISVAAMFALVVMFGIKFYEADFAETQDCIAYVNGNVVNDDSEVLALVMGDLAEMNTASVAVEDVMNSQLSAMSSVMVDVENN